MTHDDDHAQNGLEFIEDEEADVAPNEARVIITLTREQEGIDGFIDTIEGLEFDPGDMEDFPGRDVLRLAAEMVLLAAGYDDGETRAFLETAARGPVELS